MSTVEAAWMASGFLASRGIALPEGSPQDPETSETAWGLANRKNTLFHQEIDQSVIASSTIAARPGSTAAFRLAVTTAVRNPRALSTSTSAVAAANTIIRVAEALRTTSRT